jgi:hypothetical protein
VVLANPAGDKIMLLLGEGEWKARDEAVVHRALKEP